MPKKSKRQKAIKRLNLSDHVIIYGTLVPKQLKDISLSPATQLMRLNDSPPMSLHQEIAQHQLRSRPAF
jgi:hypothetical protein